MLTSRILISTQHRPTQGRSCYFSWAVREQPQSTAWRKSLAAVCWEFLVKTSMYPNLCSLPLHSFFSNLLLPLTFIPSHLPFFSPSFVVFHPLISCFLTRQKLIFSYWSYPYLLGLPRAWKILTLQMLLHSGQKWLNQPVFCLPLMDTAQEDFGDES